MWDVVYTYRVSTSARDDKRRGIGVCAFAQERRTTA